MNWTEDIQNACIEQFEQGLSIEDVTDNIRGCFCPEEERKTVRESIRNHMFRNKSAVMKKDLSSLYADPQRIKCEWTGEKTIRFGLLGDTHLGSKYAQITHLHEYYEWLKENGVEVAYHTGDITDGIKMREGHEYELYAIGIDEQVADVEANYPTGVKTYFITGNHDHSLVKKLGYNIGENISQRRTDMVYCGADQAYINLTENCILELRHPGGGTPYAISYPVQKMVNAMYGGSKPNIFAMGHMHKKENITVRNVECFQTASFQAQSSFMRSHASESVVGGWLVEASVNDEGTLLEIASRFKPFFKINRDDYMNWR